MEEEWAMMVGNSSLGKTAWEEEEDRVGESSGRRLTGTRETWPESEKKAYFGSKRRGS